MKPKSNKVNWNEITVWLDEEQKKLYGKKK